MLALLQLAVTVAVLAVVYNSTRRFVRERLRFVDAAQRPIAPFVAGGVVALVAAPVVWLLPLVGAGTALAAGLAVGAGVARGARDVRRGTGNAVVPVS